MSKYEYRVIGIDGTIRQAADQHKRLTPRDFAYACDEWYPESAPHMTQRRREAEERWAWATGRRK